MVGLFWPTATVKEKDISSRLLEKYLLQFPQLINQVLFVVLQLAFNLPQKDNC